MPTDYFLSIDGIAGDSLDAKHKGEIEVQSFSWGETQSGSVAAGGGAGAGRVSMQDLHMTTRTSKAGPQLLLACASGKHFKTAALTARRSGTVGGQEFLTFSLTDVLVSSYQTSGAGGADGPEDAVSLNFGRIVVEYREQNPDGSPGPTTKAGWDVKANKKV